MIIKFEYKYDMTYHLFTESRVTIEGNGKWEVNEEELAEDFCKFSENFENFLEEYIVEELEFPFGSKVNFDSEDIKELKIFCEKYKLNI